MTTEKRDEYQREIRVRIRATGQVIDMAPDAARARLLSGIAERVDAESMAVGAAPEAAVAPAQSVARKPLFSRRRTG